jgi:Ca-activated chloride channel family protein
MTGNLPKSIIIKAIGFIFIGMALIITGCGDQEDYPYYMDRSVVNLSICIDRSGSMEGSKIVHAKEALKIMIDMLNRNDILSVVLFESAAEVLIEPTFVSDKLGLQEMIETIGATGGTLVSSCLQQSYPLVAENFDASKENIVILLCDGDVDAGSIAIVEEYQAKGIKLSSIGIGAGVDNESLENLSSAGGGASYYVQNEVDLQQTFVDALERILYPDI